MIKMLEIYLVTLPGVYDQLYRNQYGILTLMYSPGVMLIAQTRLMASNTSYLT
jgi:hypothetical protein